REQVYRALGRIAEEGFGMLGLPGELGGENDIPASILVFETLGFGDMSVLVKFGVQFGLFGGSILQLGTEHHHRTWLASVGRLELPGCYAMTEVDHGSNVRDLETEAHWDPEVEGFRIRTPHPGARKDWIGNAALHGRMATVFARLVVEGEDHGVHAFLVPIRDEEGRTMAGVEIEDCGAKVGLHGVDNGRLAFRDVTIPRGHLLDRFGQVTKDGRYESSISSPGRRFFTMLETLVTGRISIAAASVSAAKTGLAIAIRYSADRRQFGPSGKPEMPILGYLSQQRLLLPRLAATYGLHFAVRQLVERMGARSSHEDDPGIETLAAGLKVLASRNAQETLQACREACGGRGYLAENRLGTLRDDTDVFTTFEGANVVLLQLVARSLLSEYRDQMGELDLRGIIRLVSERAGAEVQRRNPIRSRRTGEEHLRDPETHREAFRFREQRLLSSVARRLKHRIDGEMDSFEALNECQDHVVSLGRAHMEAEVLDAFLAGAADAPDEDVRLVLESLAALWALERLEADRAWFLEAGWMEPPQSRALRGLVNRLCGELADQAVPLVDAFGIPDSVLRAPAAFGSGRPGRTREAGPGNGG
ncbi:MAG: acyl-CoA oxidase, partial [Gemmatimonadales bacterium]